MRTCALILGLMMAALIMRGGCPAQAAEVQLQVVDRKGAAISGHKVSLLPVGSGSFSSGRRRFQISAFGKVLTSDGRATFEYVSPGTYQVAMDLRGTRLISPHANPLRPAPVFTISPEDNALELRVEVFHGVPVHLFLDLPVNIKGFQARVRHPASGAEMTFPLHGDGQETTHLLPRGIWEVDVIPIEGFLLVGVLVDRQEWMGTTVVLDLVSNDVPPDVVFSFSAQVEIEGVVTEINKNPPAVAIRASLLEPGSWYEAALARGVEIPQQVRAPLDNLDRYHRYLPTGRWRVEPVGEALVASTPEFVERFLGPGEILRADFAVEIELNRDSSTPLRAQVEIQDRFEARGSVGAVFDEAGGSGPRWSGNVQHDLLEAYGLPAGRYQVVAGHIDTLEQRITVEHDPEQAPEQVPELLLSTGAAVKLIARSIEGKRREGIRLAVERLDDLPELLLTDPNFLAAKKERTLTSDLAGGGRATGFYGGLHRFEARLGGERKTTGIVEMRIEKGPWLPFLEARLQDSKELTIEVRERPAARLEASLDCSDAWQLPETVSVLLLDGWELDEEVPLLSLEGHVLTGRRQDKLVLGPLDAGNYVLGLRPEGFARWTWVYGAEEPRKAEAVTIEKGARDARRGIDLGPVLMECGPAVDLFPRIATGAPFPPLREVRMFARSISQATEQGLKELDLKRRKRRLELRDMPRGEQVLEIRLEHPWFLPTPELLWSVPIELERGMYHEIEVEVEGLGGAIDLRGLDGLVSGAEAVVRAVREGHTSDAVAVRAHRALIPSLLPGRWRLELCRTSQCAAPLPLKEVKVNSGQTVKLDLDSRLPP